ncbi:hypothetical protein PRV_02010 [Mycoplasma parvum str. Indiana]|uniref:Uncharacterized protein n=1 Tax=Mycoplasma parvum str. Indiana TaxID=1403316 RepID=U5NCS5_9MOLU|nr:hypothetical protein PRV_02010 [Mycoplasma parvum str. Indiana]
MGNNKKLQNNYPEIYLILLLIENKPKSNNQDKEFSLNPFNFSFFILFVKP